MPKHTWIPSTSRPTRGFGRLRGMSRRAHLDKAQPSQVHGVHGTPSLLLGLAGTSARPLASHPRSSLPAWPGKRGRVVLASVAWKTTTVRPATYVWSGVHSSRLDRLTAIRSTETNSSERDGFDSEDVLHVSVACCVEPHRPVQTNADIFVSEARSGSWTGLSQSWPTCLAAGGRRTGVPATQEELERRGFQGPPAMQPDEILEVPPDGDCLFHCAVTCRNVQRLRSSAQDPAGFMSERRCEKDFAEASRRLRRICSAAAAKAGRDDVVKMLRSARLPEGGVVWFLAQWLEGSIWVTLDGVSGEFDVLVGEGPIACKLVLCTVVNGTGRSSPHYRLAGSWVAQL